MYHKLKKCLNCRSSHQRCSIEKFHNIHRKTPALESLFNRVAGAGLKTCNCIKRDFNKGFFCEYCENFKKTCFQENLQTTASAVPASYCQNFSQGLRSALNSIYLFSPRPPLRFKGFSLGCLMADSSIIRKKKNQPKWPLVVIRCHLLYHSLLFVGNRCTTRCHSLSFVVT